MKYERSDLLINYIPSDMPFSFTSSIKKAKEIGLYNYTPIRQLHMIMIMARITFYPVILLDELDCIS